MGQRGITQMSMVTYGLAYIEQKKESCVCGGIDLATGYPCDLPASPTSRASDGGKL